MIKRTIYFGNPAYLSLHNAQMIIRNPELVGDEDKTVPVEDMGVMILDNKQITITQGLLEALLENNVAVVTCDSSHLPTGLLLPLCGNTTQNERFRNQMDVSLPLRKQLWQQTMQSKISNQAYVLNSRKGMDVSNMLFWANSVRSGDPENIEARAAVYYWKYMFPDVENFIRDRDGVAPNNLLNYGYAILRAIVARALVGSGLLPTIGIHHHNKYNAYCLADDIMEPYRPYVDNLVLDIIESGMEYETIDTGLKKRFLSIPVIDVVIDGERSPLMVAVGQTTASLAKCFNGEIRRISYPSIRTE